MMHRLIEHVPGHLRLRGRYCLIAGAGSDLGATIARVFAVEGCKILAVDEDVAALRAVVSTIQEEGGEAAHRQVAKHCGLGLEAFLALEQSTTFQRFDIVVDACFGRIQEQEQSTNVTMPELAKTSIRPFTVRVMSKCSSNRFDPPSDPIGQLATPRAFVSNRFRVNEITFGYGPKKISTRHQSLSRTSPPYVKSTAAADDRAIKLQIANAALFLASEEAALIHNASLWIGPDEMDESPKAD